MDPEKHERRKGKSAVAIDLGSKRSGILVWEKGRLARYSLC